MTQHRLRTRVAPQVEKLGKRHRKARDRLTRELPALNRAEGISPFAGLLPALLQAPFFPVMYRLFTTAPGRPRCPPTPPPARSSCIGRPSAPRCSRCCCRRPAASTC
ncbi:YidC/Oxa1 family membrane protein insertase [Kitasatospora sp. CB01950]|uniref:YidC/Oxa1 family membrane protein insertase n=1 Tax=Kitasatospora sp. CB01950 TaxID=1703930 RepID=UPI000A9BE291